MDLKTIRVLQISKYMYPFRGGTEQVAQDIVHALNKCGIPQKVICFNEDAEEDGKVCHHRETIYDKYDNVDVIRCGYEIKIASQAISYSYPKELKILMDDFKPNVIILHYPNPYVTHFLLKYKNRNFKLLIYWHLDITRQKHLKKLFHRQNLMLIDRATKILGATPAHVDESEFTEQFGDKRYILPYTIDEKSLNITDDEKKKAEAIREKYNGKVLGFFIGRHVPYKGLEYLIKASAYIKAENVHFLIAGSGDLTEELKELAKDDNKIEFIGRISDSDRRAYLYACDIFCFPSITRNEGFGLALAEGMYYGKPAVTFTIKGSGVNYVNLDGVTGIECPNRDYEAYAKAIETLVRDGELRKKLGKNARERVLNNFTQEKFGENLTALLLNI